jgi:hypothetical protein
LSSLSARVPGNAEAGLEGTFTIRRSDRNAG